MNVLTVLVAQTKHPLLSEGPSDLSSLSVDGAVIFDAESRKSNSRKLRQRATLQVRNPSSYLANLYKETQKTHLIISYYQYRSTKYYYLQFNYK